MKICTCKRALLVGATLLLAAALPSHAANVTVPLLELYTWGHETTSGDWGLESSGEIELALDGGYKFGGSVLFGFQSDLLEVADLAGTSLTFRAASVTLRELFGAPLDLTYFIGRGPTLASGELFFDFFGTPPLQSEYTSFVHFPGPAATTTYEGIFTPTGTGFQLDYAPQPDRWLLSLLLYQDALIDVSAGPVLGVGHYSLDVRYALNLPVIKLESFLGATYPAVAGDYGCYRAGALLFAGGEKAEFLAAVGLPLWDPVADAMSLDLFYLLLEQRLRFKVLSVVTTALWRPQYYQQQATGEKALDANLDVQFGTIESLISGGLEGNLVYDPAATDELTGKVTPYLRLSTSGVVFETRLSGRVWPFDFADMFELFFVVKAQF